MLPQPHLEYTKPGSLDTGNRGQWNLGGIQFLKGGKIIGWGLVSFERQDRVSGPGDSGKQASIAALSNELSFNLKNRNEIYAIIVLEQQSNQQH